MSIKVSDLTKTYGTQKAIDGISFEASKGEILGFLGPNGAGKSTTMKIATCFLPQTSGSVSVCGFDTVQSPLEVRKKIGYLPEHNPLYLEMFVHEILRFTGKLYGLKGASLKQRVEEIIALCGLEKEQNKKVEALSKGYRQRVGLAQSMIHDPEVLILDEPTTGLDPNQLVEIRNLIKSISKNKTVVFSTHIMQEVQALCDRVVVINQGILVANDTISELHGTSTKQQKICIELSGKIDIGLLRAIEGVTKIEVQNDTQFVLSTNMETDIRPLIFNCIVQNDLILLEMRKITDSIETVFQELTTPKA